MAAMCDTAVSSERHFAGVTRVAGDWLLRDFPLVGARGPPRAERAAPTRGGTHVPLAHTCFGAAP